MAIILTYTLHHVYVNHFNVELLEYTNIFLRLNKYRHDHKKDTTEYEVYLYLHIS